MELEGEARVEGHWTGIRRIMFAVDDIEDVLARLRTARQRAWTLEDLQA